ncbi:CsbD family protein [Undibacterium sp. Di26W]|uniref:CsbD family protein n=1 Tax=Undibacterium sp. Di26W TaxID=3413035 RepID=UPI003BEF617F
MMNSDQIKGVAKKVAGKVQQEGGKLAGSKKQQAKGAAKQVEGSMQEALGNIKEVFKTGQQH